MKYLLFTMILLLSACWKASERTKAKVSTLTESVYASAKVKAVGQYEVFSTVPGIIEKIRVKPGDRVRAGDELFDLDNRIALLNRQSARIGLEVTQENLRKSSDRVQELELRVRAAQDKFLLDSTLYVRQKRLWSQNIGTRVAFEQQRLAYRTSRSTYLATRRQLGQLRTDLKNNLRNATVNYDLTRERESDYTIKSNISGLVFDVIAEVGELVTAQTPLAVIGHNRYLLEMSVDERDMARVHAGQRVEIVLDSYEKQVFQGRVQRVYPLMDERTSTFKVDAVFLEAPAKLFPNQQAEANIIIQTKRNALVIPRAFLDSEGNVWISKREKRAVKTGFQDYQKVEIVSGLDTGEYIYKPTE